MHQQWLAHVLIQITLQKFYLLLPVSTLACSAHLGAGASLLGDSDMAGQLRLTCSHHDLSLVHCGLLASRTNHSRQWFAHSKCVLEGLGLQVGALMMSSNWNVKDMTTKYWSNPAKFRDLIRVINQRADLGLLICADSDFNPEQWLELECWQYDFKLEILKQSCQNQRFNQRDKQRADLVWRLAVHMVIWT